MLMTNKLTLPVESRMQGDLHVRFGGRLWETYHRKVVRRPSPSLQRMNLSTVPDSDEEGEINMTGSYVLPLPTSETTN